MRAAVVTADAKSRRSRGPRSVQVGMAASASARDRAVPDGAGTIWDKAFMAISGGGWTMADKGGHS